MFFQFVHSLTFFFFLMIFRRYQMWAGLTYSIPDLWSCPLGRTSSQSSWLSQKQRAVGTAPIRAFSMNGGEPTGIDSASLITQPLLPCTRKRILCRSHRRLLIWFPAMHLRMSDLVHKFLPFISLVLTNRGRLYLGVHQARPPHRERLPGLCRFTTTVHWSIGGMPFTTSTIALSLSYLKLHMHPHATSRYGTKEAM